MKVKELIKALDLSDSYEIKFNIGDIRQLIYCIPSSEEKRVKDTIVKDMGEYVVEFICKDDEDNVNYEITIKGEAT